MSLIEINSISKHYGRKKILNNITLSGEAGDCIGIIGSNGCGKSTLLKILSGAISPSHGKITYAGDNPLSNSKYFAAHIGYVPQENPLFGNLTVLDNLKLWYCDSRHNLKDDIENGLIAEFGLNKYLKEKVSHLSGGMKKRLSIACALSKDPEILILDEPGASLDIIAKNDIIKYMKKYIAEGGTILIASHEEGELSVCNRKYLMQDGTLVETDPSLSITAIMERMVKTNA